MNLVPLYKLLDDSAAPQHAKEVISGLLTCKGHRKVTRKHFDTDPDLQALSKLGLITLEAKGIIVTKKARELAGVTPVA